MGWQPAAKADWERLSGDFEASIQASRLSLRTVEHYSDVLRRVLLGHLREDRRASQGLDDARP